LLTYVFPLFGIDAVWGFVFLGVGFVASAIFTLAPLGRRKRLTVAAEAKPVAAAAEASVYDELETGPIPVHHVDLLDEPVSEPASTPATAPVSTRGPVAARHRPVESGDPELEHHDRRTP